MTTVAIIPARGGSKGIPQKNLQTICGVSLLGRAVTAALRAESIDQVLVSTDSAAIAAEARRFGAGVIDRPAELATDEAESFDVVEHALAQLETQPDLVAVVQCTSLVAAEDIDGCVAMIRGNTMCAISVAEDYGLILSGAARPLSYDPIIESARRQLRDPRYRFFGGVCVWRRRDRVGTPLRTVPAEHTALHVVPEERAIDIDSPVDLVMAEALIRYQDTWIVIGAGPDAPEQLAAARGRLPAARLITTNSGIDLFDEGDAPDVYMLFDFGGCELYAKRALQMRSRHGTRLVTAERTPEVLQQRGIAEFDQFVPISRTESFVRDGYSAVLSGLLCVQYALNHGALSVHLVGMNGYTGELGGDYFDGHEPLNGAEKRRRHTETIIEPFFERATQSNPDIQFTFWGRLNYQVAGPNVFRAQAPAEDRHASAH